MFEHLRELKRALSVFLRRQSSKIAEINKRYAKPRMKISKTTGFALLMLRLYLILLVGILLFKFFTMLGK